MAHNCEAQIADVFECMLELAPDFFPEIDARAFQGHARWLILMQRKKAMWGVAYIPAAYREEYEALAEEAARAIIRLPIEESLPVMLLSRASADHKSDCPARGLQ